jgi:hypothetical protein
LPSGLSWPLKLTIAISAPLFFAALIYTVSARAGWYDEFYTLYVTQPRFGWGEALREHWLPDNHPPLYYTLVRATSWLGASLEAHRVVNLLIAATAIVGGAAMLHGGQGAGRDRRSLAILYFLFLASLSAPFPLVGELRSYFLSFCSVALLVLALVLLQIDEAKPTLGRRLILWLSALSAFNTHIVTTVIAGSVLLPFIALAVGRRDWARVRLFIAPAVVAGTIFLAVVTIQFRLWIGNTEVFWLPGGADQAFGAFGLVLLAAVSSHVLMVLGGLAGLSLLARRGLREPALLVAAMLVIGLVLAGLLLLGLHLWRPLIIPKYLTGLFPPIGMIVALGFAALIEAVDRKIAAALLLAALALFGVSLCGNIEAVKAFVGWDPAAREVRRQFAACPGTVVHVETHWNAYLAGLQPPDNARAVPYSYRLVAARHGFVVEPDTSLSVSVNCPTLFWGQAAGQGMPKVSEVLDYERRRGFDLPGLWFYKRGEGWIASNRPLTPPAPPAVPALPPLGASGGSSASTAAR